MNQSNKIFRNIFFMITVFPLLFCSSLSAYAEVELPPGTVAGLPDGLTVLDSDGNPVDSETGEYFFYVEDMEPGTEYSKDVQIMNLREDKAYDIYFYAESVDKEGDIDLENECTAVMTLDGEEFYRGLVTGKGNVDMTEDPVHLGSYEPGDSKVLNCTVTWDAGDAGGAIDNGHILVGPDGVTVLREGSGDSEIHGEVRFKWIFYAIVNDDYHPPKTGILVPDTTMAIVLLSVAGVMVAGMIVLILLKKHRENDVDEATRE